jgi:hypothetical protein
LPRLKNTCMRNAPPMPSRHVKILDEAMSPPPAFGFERRHTRFCYPSETGVGYDSMAAVMQCQD